MKVSDLPFLSRKGDKMIPVLSLSADVKIVIKTEVQEEEVVATPVHPTDLEAHGTLFDQPRPRGSSPVLSRKEPGRARAAHSQPGPRGWG